MATLIPNKLGNFQDRLAAHDTMLSPTSFPENLTIGRSPPLEEDIQRNGFVNALNNRLKFLSAN